MTHIRCTTRRVVPGLLLIGLLGLGSVRADPPEGYPFVAYDAGFARARTENRPVFLYFGRYGCAWCDKTNREAFSDPKLRDLYIRHYVLVYVDAESGKRLTLPSGERITELELGSRMKVLATPVFAYLHPDGREIFRIPGIQSTTDFLLYDRFIAEGHYRKESIRDFLARETR
jgi:thioredoxin-related protein